VLKTVLTRPD